MPRHGSWRLTPASGNTTIGTCKNWPATTDFPLLSNCLRTRRFPGKPHGLAAWCLVLALLGSFPVLGENEPSYALDGAARFEGEKDPFERFNRKVFAFNETMDKWVVLPVAKGYRAVTPEFLDRGISNFFDNLLMVPAVANSLLVGELEQALRGTGRFLVNSTVGLLGFVDVATDLGIETVEADFGGTLAQWGLEEGPYVVVPFLGGRNVRDLVGMVPDYYLHPVSYIEDDTARYGLRGLDLVDIRADLIDLEEVISGDRYIFLRDAYLQSRRASLGEGTGIEDLDASGFTEDDWE